MPNVHHESQYCETGLPDRSTAEDYRWKDGPVDQVGWMLDQLDNRGSFLRRHLARMCYAWATLALVQEATPYMFASLRDEFALSVTDLGVFAASFQLGCVAGAALSVASLDTYGRHCSALVALAACVVCSTLSAIAWKSFAAVVVLRVLQSCAWTVASTSMATWYAEFLPTKGRGALMATYSIGWPIGRFLAIALSRAGFTWRAMYVFMAVSLGVLELLLHTETETPRYLAQCGQYVEAREVLERIFSLNGQVLAPPSCECPLMSDRALAEPEQTGIKHRLFLLKTEYLMLMVFSSSMFVVLASTTVLIDTWGPSLFQRVLYPDESELPHEVLFLFSFGDMCGIIVSIAVADRIGRKGSFYVGFGVQACLFFFLAWIVSAFTWSPGLRTRMIVLIGFVAQATRCFGWEAANMWVVEAFPTIVRATAVALTSAIMRFAAITTVSASANAASAAPPDHCFIYLAVLLSIGITLAHLLPKETANASMGEKDRENKL